MLRKRSAFMALLLAFALIAAACSDDDSSDTTTSPPATAAPDTAAPDTAAPETTPPETTPPVTGAPVAAPKLCEITDVGGIDDASFNESAWVGAQQAEAEYGSEISFLESNVEADYRPNIDSLIDEGCDLVITVGFTLAAATAQAAVDNPDQKFAIVDQSFFPGEPWTDADGNDLSGNGYFNVRGLVFQTDEAGFLAGYLAAAYTETGVVGTFGGVNIPPVTIFMDGFAWGVDYYNEVNGTSVVVLGWDPVAAEGLFTNNFESLEDGASFAQSLVDEGADIVLPVAGPVGLGSAAVCQDTGACVMIGVDADQFFTAPNFADVWLTSIQKNIAEAIFSTATNLVEIGALGNLYNGTLANGGVGLAPEHDVAWPEGIAAELADIEAGIIDGSILINTVDRNAEE